MITVSDKFKKEIATGNNQFLFYGKITLTDGTVLNISEENLWENGLVIEDAVSDDSSFQLGGAIINQCTLILNNVYGTYTEYDFCSATLEATIGLFLEDGTVEKVRKGVYIVDEPEYNGSLITLTCYDNMYRFDKDFSTNLEYPATLLQIVREACLKCGVTLQTINFPHSDFKIAEIASDESTTYREILSYIAQIAGCFCRCDVYGRLEIKWFNQTALENPIENRDNLHEIDSVFEKTISTDDVVITGVKVTESSKSNNSDDEDKTYMAGTDGYVIAVEDNPLIANGNGKEITQWLGNQLIGLQFRKGELTHQLDPTIEAGDVAVYFDDKGNKYKMLVSGTTFSINASQVTRSSAETPARNSSQRYSNTTKTYVDLRKAIVKEKTERELAIEGLNGRLDNASGTYTTIETDSAGGQIFYLHNKPTLAESSMAWKMTSEAFGVSTTKDADGNFIWSAGMTVDGDAITRILNAVGISASWVNTGALTIRDDNGDIIFSADMDSRKVIVSGAAVQIGGQAADEAIAASKAEAKEYSDGKLADYAEQVTSDLEKLQQQVDGAIETYYLDYEPLLTNKPASDWKTEEQKKEHEGDLFYWKTKGFGYRFFYDSSVKSWKWVLIQDTDITKALAAASEAQSTANSKKRVFVEQPVPPYDVGDLWSQSGGDLLTCVVARVKSGIFAQSDWQKRNNYVDDKALADVKKSSLIGADVLYALSDSPVEAPESGWDTLAPEWTSGKYMWQKTKYYYGDGSTSESDATCLTGATGIDGRGISKTAIEYAEGSDGKTPPTGNVWSSSIPTVAVGKYLWTRTTITYTDNTNTVSYAVGKFGETGNGIASVENYYLASDKSTGITSDTSGWTTTIQTMTSTKKFLWNYEVTTYTNGTTGQTSPVVIGVYGTNGRGIKSITEYYLVLDRTDGVSTSTTGWSTTIQKTSLDNKYLWNYELITYSDDTTEKTTPRIIGTHGETGNGIASITEHYAVSNSRDVAPTEWQDDVPVPTDENPYLWNYETIKYTDGSTINGNKKIIGTYGTGIKEIRHKYLAINKSSGVTNKTSGWTSEPQTPTADKKYLWNYEVVEYTNGGMQMFEAKIIGVYGDTGKGVGSVTEQYYLSTSSSSVTGGTWSHDYPTWEKGKYIWTRSKIVWSDKTETYTDPVLAKAVNNANENAAQALENSELNDPFISGTQTAATHYWTGVAPFPSLNDGQKITYWLPFAGNGNATILQLTLKGGSKTGMEPVYYGGSTRLVNQYPAGSIVRLVYRKNIQIGNSSYTGWWCDANYDSGNTYDRTKYIGTIKASSAITAGTLIVGNSSGYHPLKAGTVFDISYPVLYAASAIASGSTGNNNYSVISVTITNTQNITLSAYKSVYIKGKLSGSNFTPVSTAPLVQTIPTSTDGFYYMLLGIAYTSTTMILQADHPIYRYLGGKFQKMGSTADETVLAWCKDNNLTYIDGGKLYANSVTADKINVNDLFAQNIEATNLHLKGDSSVDGAIVARSLVLGDGEITVDFGTDTVWGVYAVEFKYYTGVSESPSNVMYVSNESVGMVAGTITEGGGYSTIADVTVTADGTASITGNSILVNGTELGYKQDSAGCYFKDGYTCHLHAWWVDATSVFFGIAPTWRPKAYVTCVGFCQRKDDAKTFPLMCELEESGSWQVWAMTGIGVSGGQSMWTVYQPANGIDHRSEFTVCITGSWATSHNGG